MLACLCVTWSRRLSNERPDPVPAKRTYRCFHSFFPPFCNIITVSEKNVTTVVTFCDLTRRSKIKVLGLYCISDQIFVFRSNS